VEYRSHDSDEDEFDKYGRRKKNVRKNSDASKDRTFEKPVERDEEVDDEEDEDEEEEGDDDDLVKNNFCFKFFRISCVRHYFKHFIFDLS